MKNPPTISIRILPLRRSLGRFLILLFFWLPQIHAQEIDFPLSQSEIGKYASRIRIQRLPNVAVTHPDAYKIRPRKQVYPPSVKQITLDVINVNAPTAEPEYHRLKHLENGRWKEFPFIDHLAFAGVGRDLSEGDTLPEDISMSEFKYPLKAGNRYQVNFYVFTKLYAPFLLSEQKIHPNPDAEAQEAFTLRVLKSDNDSIRILFENHTNLTVQPFFPSVETDKLDRVHPLARSGWIGEVDYMKRHARLKGGEALLFVIPASWDANRITDPNYKKQFHAGRLPIGRYKIGLQLHVYMDTEFDIK